MAGTLQAAALSQHDTKQLPAAAALVALGIVYGDIGTSPLYAFKQAAQAGRRERGEGPTVCRFTTGGRWIRTSGSASRANSVGAPHHSISRISGEE